MLTFNDDTHIEPLGKPLTLGWLATF